MASHADLVTRPDLDAEIRDLLAVHRQAALGRIAPRCDAMVVIGSANSSNTTALARLATDAGCPRVFRINDADELPDDLSGTVGVTAGASAPEDLVAAVIKRLAPRHGVEEISVTTEDEYFPPPRHLRDLLGVLDAFVTVGAGGALDRRPKTPDRAVAASDVLAALADSSPGSGRSA